MSRGRGLRLLGRAAKKAAKVARGTPGTDGWGKPKKSNWTPGRSNNEVWNKPRRDPWK